MYTHSIYGLTSYAKKYFISNYKTECTIENGYIIFIIKHPHHSGRNVMLDLWLTVLIVEPGRLCVGDRAGLPGLGVFSRQHICCTDVGGDRSGGYFSAAASRLRHIIIL